MSKLQITGKFLGHSAVKEVGANNTKTRSFWLDISENEYANTPEFQLMGDKITLTESLQKGTMVEVSFNLSGNRYKNQTTGKEAVFTNLKCWKIDLIKRESAATTGLTADPNAGVDDLPF